MTLCARAAATGYAGHGGIRAIMDDMTLLSTEAEGVNDTIPEDHKASHVNSAGRVGALLGLTELSSAADLSNGDADSVVPDKVHQTLCITRGSQLFAVQSLLEFAARPNYSGISRIA